MLLNGSCGQYGLWIKRNLLFRFGAKHLSTLPANTTLTQCWSNAGPPSATVAQHQTSTGSTPRVPWDTLNPVNIFVEHLYNVGPTSKTLYKCYTNVLCLLGIAAGLYCLILVLLAAITSQHRPNVCQMLGQRRRCWPVSIQS